MHNDFGSTLRNARLRKGLDINTVARQLRIRPDIIEVIETSDFDHMPPRGYARNMVSSYAHLLGLDSAEVTKRYLDEQYAYQVNLARGHSDPKDARGSAPGRSQPENTSVSAWRNTSRSAHSGDSLPWDRTADSDRFGRRVYDDSVENHPDYATPHPRNLRTAGSDRTYRSMRHRSNESTLGTGYLNAYGGPSKGGSWASNTSMRDRMPQIAIAAVVVILLILLLVLVAGPKDSSDDEVTNMPVTSVAESSSTSEDGTVAEPTDFEFGYEVEDGSSVWIEVYVDGATEVSETVEGPASDTFTVTKKVEFIAGNTEGLTVTQNGEAVELETTDDGGVDLTLTFKKYLKQWREANGVSESDESSDDSSDSTSSSSDDSAS